MDVISLPKAADYLAPDSSEIRLLPSTPRGGLAHCRLNVGRTSRPVKHKSVEEIWYCMSGRGELWRRYGQAEEVVELRPGAACLIGFQEEFQFRCLSAREQRSGNVASRARDPEALQLLIATFPGWPGPDEAVFLKRGKWPWKGPPARRGRPKS